MLAYSHTFGRVTSAQGLTPVTATAVTVIQQKVLMDSTKFLQRRSQKPFTSRVPLTQLIVTKLYIFMLYCKEFFPPPTKVRGFQNQGDL